MMRNLAWATLAVLALGACSAHRQLPGERSLDPGDRYVDAFRSATKFEEYFEDLDVHTEAYGTLVTPAFRQAFREEYESAYGVTAPEEVGLERLTVIFAVSSNRAHVTEIDAFSRLWAVSFADGTTTVTPSRIEAFDRDRLFLRYFFPYWSPWQKIYRIEFPLDANTGKGTLQLKGIAGDIRFTW